MTMAAEHKLRSLVDTAISNAIKGFRESTPTDSETARFVDPKERYDENIVRAAVGLHLARTASRMGSDIVGVAAFEGKIRRLEAQVDDLQERLPGIPLDPPEDRGWASAPAARLADGTQNERPAVPFSVVLAEGT